MVDHHLVRNNASAVSNTIRGVRLVEYYNPMSANATAFGKEMYEPPQWIHVFILSPYNYSWAVAQFAATRPKGGEEEDWWQNQGRKQGMRCLS